ncbi:protein of unknown function [Paenibacillus sp. UNC496MF]|uniref:stalk domain-containing protein n=1 Tax=Paenibacillus sp. UNC496MF TaxID=1502753 RepID=UPI0008F17FFD|nr:stalk domain-containing protein [Paenibacillus sp. UNC496MF]SFI59210.1 protein of unknown function [Paenibacillus sp. UNC496MF]
MKKKIIVTTAVTSVIAISTAFGAYAATKFTIMVNGKAANTDAKVINGLTYLPLRDIGTLLGANIQYDASTKTVKVDNNASQSPSTGTGNSTTPPVGSIGLSRSNPAPLGTTVTYSVKDYSDSYTGQLTLEEVIRGDRAWQMIHEENQFNDPAPDGYEYVLAKINVKVVKNNEKDAQVRFNSYSFTLVSSQGKDYEKASVVTPDELEASLYEGASDSGYAAFLVKKADANPLIAFGRDYDGKGGVWLKP